MSKSIAELSALELGDRVSEWFAGMPDVALETAILLRLSESAANVEPATNRKTRRANAAKNNAGK